jgi:hypothetical protein
MSYFSLLKPALAEEGYVVDECHINVWSLAGLLGHRPMIVDIGVMFHAEPEATVRALEMVIPARVVKQMDLSKEILDSENARLIFGRHFRSSDHHAIELRQHGRVPVVPVVTLSAPDRLDRITDETSRELTAVRVELAAVPLEGKAYSRVRFVVDHSGSLWRWNRVLGRRSGAIIDLRVHDPREGGAGAHAPAQIHERDLPIGSLEAFFMLPERFHLGGQNPELAYTRTLDGRRWRNYLRRGVAGPLRREVMLVHRWGKHGEEAEPAVSSEHPFRGYLQFERSPGLRATSDLLAVAIATTALAFAVFRGAGLRSGVVDGAKWLGHAAQVGDHIVLPAGFGVAVLLTVLTRLGKVPGRLRRVKRALKIVEHWWFQTIGH